jgi:hypothetical protein
MICFLRPQNHRYPSSLEAQASTIFGPIGHDAERQRPGLSRGEVTEALGMGQHNPRAAHIEGMVDLRRRVAVVERRRDESCLEAGEIVGDQRDAVRHQRGKAIAGLQPEREIARPKTARHAIEL